MIGEGKAVFLNYAHEDSDIARRIADALRSHGIEAWFDQSELRGGDAWDANIRRQIHHCALFVPIVSAHTEARKEGYFRREWKLAVDRLDDIAEGVPFLVPICVDDTAERTALVPAAFLRVQWTRLRGNEGAGEFCARVRHLLGAEPVQLPESVNRMPESRDFALPAGRRGFSQWRVAAAVVAAIGIGGFFALRPAKEDPPTASNPKLKTQNAETASVASAKSIAVLPFANLSDDKDASGFFADGIHEDILTNLTLIHDLRVVSRTSVMGYRGTTKKMSNIAKELGVAYILEGSVRRAGNKVRVKGQLIRAATDEHMWAKNYDRDLTDIFAIQSELSQAIAGELKVALSPQEQKLLNRRPTGNIAAYDLFLKARELRNSNSRTPAFFKQEEEWLNRAVELDPRFGHAWAALAWVHGYQYLFNLDRSEKRVALAKSAIERAVQISPDDPYVMLERGYYFYFCFRDYARASEIFDQLLRLQPNDAATHYALANIRRREGKWPEALESHRQASQLDAAEFRLSELVHYHGCQGASVPGGDGGAATPDFARCGQSLAPMEAGPGSLSGPRFHG